MMDTGIYDRLNFFEEFDKLRRNKPDKVVLSDGPKETDLTVAQLHDISARVYRYLVEHNIGKEDMVNIFLPRGCVALACLFGVWKAGAAAVILEDDYPSERVSFIRKDCDCKLVIDKEVWESILNTEPLDGHEPLERHAAAFAVYTSGTTGNPKGVLHEYGQIATCYFTTSWDGEPLYREDDVFPLYFPLNFVPAVMIVSFVLTRGTKALVVSDEIRKDLNKLRQFLIDNKVRSAYFPPSMFRSVSDFGPYLESVFLCSEPANGIWKDPKEMLVLNGYASSETASTVTFALLDKPNEIAPIGTPRPGVKIYLLDEEGREVSEGETGEFCCEMPYTRGYINLPEENAVTFKNGIYHTGDLARKDVDGNYYLIGRIKDTVSVNGKRVEPTEVEAVIRRVTGIDRVAVRGFLRDGGSYLCAYHLGDTEMNRYEMRDKLKAHLPYYMVPAVFVRLDEFPKNANGKIDRMSLPEPSIMDYLTDYVPPSTDIQKEICYAMQDVLSIPRIGINDDFFRLGGDSLLVMKLIATLTLEGLNVEDIYIGKTPSGIAEIYGAKAALSLGDIERADREYRKKPHRLSPNQQEMFDCQQVSPNSFMYNIYILMRVEGVRAEELARVLKNVIENHPALMTVLSIDESGNVLQRYAPEFMEEIPVEEIEKEELMRMKDDLVQPFEMLEHPLYRCRVFQAEDASYFFMDFHHIICDGKSAGIILRDISRVLSGEELEKDYYYYTTAKRMEKDEYTEQAKKYFESRYGNVNWIKNPRYDFKLPGNPEGTVELEPDISKREYGVLKDNLGFGKNILYITAGLLALSEVSAAEDVMVSWVFNGRKRKEEMNVVGVLFYDLPVALHINDDLLMADAIEEIRDQIEKGIEYSKYPYLRKECRDVVEDAVLCIMYQEDIYTPDIESEYEFEPIDIEQKSWAAQNLLDLQIVDDEEGDYLVMDYAARFYKKGTIEKYGELMVRIAKGIAGTKDFGNMTVREFLGTV